MFGHKKFRLRLTQHQDHMTPLQHPDLAVSGQADRRTEGRTLVRREEEDCVWIIGSQASELVDNDYLVFN